MPRLPPLRPRNPLLPHTLLPRTTRPQSKFQHKAARRSLTDYARTMFTLNNGDEIPAIGFGTWQDKDAQEDAVYEALGAGYRHIDTARIYGTEPSIARAISRSRLPRSHLFITSKLWNNSHHPSDVAAACDASLKDLSTDYLDLYLMHWPNAFARGDNPMPKPKGADAITNDPSISYLETYTAMESLVKSGKVKAIGISNFSHAELSNLLEHCSIPPAVHQLECHPYLAQHAFTDFHREKGIHVTQYSPFGNANPVYSKGGEVGKLIDDEVLVDIGRKYGKNGAQVALAWGLAKGRSVVPKSKTAGRIRANLEADPEGGGFRLEKEDVERIDGLDKKMRFNDPSGRFGYEFYTDLDGKT